MNHFLSDSDRDILDKAITRAENLTAAQIVLATVQRSDSYAEIPWKAFAFGVSVAGLILFIYDLLLMQWITNMMILLHIALILAAGVLPAIATVFSPSFARLLLSESRRDTETMQYAESLFLSHELFLTSGRRGILIMVSIFEKQVVILPDKGIRDKLNQEVLGKIILHMTKNLRKNKIREAFEEGLEKLVSVPGFTASDKSSGNELSNEIIEEDGV